MTPAQRAIRKAAVFHIIYGEYPALSESEAACWRQMAVEYINGQRDLDRMPMAPNALRDLIESHP